MKESDIKGLASHDGPESCACSRKTAGKALTGVHMGGVLSRENRCNQGADVLSVSFPERTMVPFSPNNSPFLKNSSKVSFQFPQGRSPRPW
jgi:hypothetical protein